MQDRSSYRWIVYEISRRVMDNETDIFPFLAMQEIDREVLHPDL